MRFPTTFHLAIVTLIGLGATALAQQPPPPSQPGGRGGRGGPPGGMGMPGGGAFITRLSLLRITEVRKELELAEEQITELEKVADEIRAKYGFGGRGGGGAGGERGRGPGGEGDRPRRDNNERDKNEGALRSAPAAWFFVTAQEPQNQPGQSRRGGGFPMPTPEQRAEFEKQQLERAREERAKLTEILLPHQLKRLNEIYVQQAGIGALQDEEIAKDLGVSDSQRARITKTREDFSTKRRELSPPGGGGGGDFETIRAKIMELTKAQDEQILAVLSAQQRTKFEEMKGKPFAMPEGGGRFGPPGAPGGNRTRSGNNN